MIQGQELELSLGLPVEITSFNDRIPRLCYPFTLKTLKRANIYLSNFNHKELEDNFNEKYKTVALITFLYESFKDEENKEELFEHIDKDCFEEVIKDMKIVSGIIDKQESTNSGSSSNRTLGWKKSINAIQKYTSNTPEDIMNMTLNQFNSLIEYIGITLSWDYKINTIQSVKDPSKYISNDEHPLAPESVSENKNYMTMNDIIQLKNLN